MLLISRAQPPPTCPRNGWGPHQKHYSRRRLNHRCIFVIAIILLDNLENGDGDPLVEDPLIDGVGWGEVDHLAQDHTVVQLGVHVRPVLLHTWCFPVNNLHSILKPTMSRSFDHIHRSMTNYWQEWAEKEIELFEDGGQIKIEKNVYHHGPRPTSIICHLPDPLVFHWPLPLIMKFSRFFFALIFVKTGLFD